MPENGSQRRSRRVRGAVFVLLVLGSLWVMIGHLRLDTEVLNLLPGTFSSVRGMESYNRDFTQARELTFGLVLDDEGSSAALDRLQEEFVVALRQQPWVVRALAGGDPMADPAGLAALPGLAAPLLLNLSPDDFQEVLASTSGERLVQRMEELRARVGAGSPAAQATVAVDPTGLLLRALEVLARHGAPAGAEMALRAEESLRLVFVVTNQPDLGAEASRELMGEVRRFRETFEEQHSGARVLVTGRAPFVDDISRSMERDVKVTLFTSLALVSFLFLVGFRQLRPLVAILAVLGAACVVGMAVGAAWFGEVNVITVGFCAILIGLGFDFGLLLASTYQQELQKGIPAREAERLSRERVVRGIFYGGATTALAFLSLTLSDSAGFVQLGVLITVGILCCALFMPWFLFVFLSPHPGSMRRDWVLAGCRNFLQRVQRQPSRWAVVAMLVAVLAGATLILPPAGIPFQADPQDLEPVQSEASRDLREISKHLQSGMDPFLAMVDEEDPVRFKEIWEEAEVRWEEARADGVLSAYTTPAPLALLPARILGNVPSVETAGRWRSEIRSAAEQAGFSEEAIAPALATVQSMERFSALPQDGWAWSEILDRASPWRFLTDRYFADQPGVAVAYLTPTVPMENAADQARMAAVTGGEDLVLTGWSYMLLDLVPWAKKELLMLTGAIGGLIVILLALIHRRVDLWAIQVLTLLLAITGLCGTLKLLGISLTLSNVLAFPLVVGVGVDYGIHLLLAARRGMEAVASVLKPVVMGGVTTLCGFGSLTLAHNPALSSLGQVCAIGVGWSLAANCFILLPLYVWKCRS